jgi:para-nitrobenzyl esterase
MRWCKYVPRHRPVADDRGRTALLGGFPQPLYVAQRRLAKELLIVPIKVRKAMPNASAPDIFVAISSITMMGLGSVEIAEKKAAQKGAPVYLYNFGYKSEVRIPGTEYAMGTPHAMDITFKFNNETPATPPGFLSGSNPDRFIASHKMAELWATFARTGRPAAADVPEWPAYTLAERATMRIDTECEVILDRFGKELATWREMGRL